MRQEVVEISNQYDNYVLTYRLPSGGQTVTIEEACLRVPTVRRARRGDSIAQSEVIDYIALRLGVSCYEIDWRQVRIRRPRQR